MRCQRSLHSRFQQCCGLLIFFSITGFLQQFSGVIFECEASLFVTKRRHYDVFEQTGTRPTITHAKRKRAIWSDTIVNKQSRYPRTNERKMKLLRYLLPSAIFLETHFMCAQGTPSCHGTPISSCSSQFSPQTCHTCNSEDCFDDFMSCRTACTQPGCECEVNVGTCESNLSSSHPTIIRFVPLFSWVLFEEFAL